MGGVPWGVPWWGPIGSLMELIGNSFFRSPHGIYYWNPHLTPFQDPSWDDTLLRRNPLETPRWDDTSLRHLLKTPPWDTPLIPPCDPLKTFHWHITPLETFPWDYSHWNPPWDPSRDLPLRLHLKTLETRKKYIQGGKKIIGPKLATPNSKTKKNFFRLDISKKTIFFFSLRKFILRIFWVRGDPKKRKIWFSKVISSSEYFIHNFLCQKRKNRVHILKYCFFDQFLESVFRFYVYFLFFIFKGKLLKRKNTTKVVKLNIELTLIFAMIMLTSYHLYFL